LEFPPLLVFADDKFAHGDCSTIAITISRAKRTIVVIILTYTSAPEALQHCIP
jgi:hypothetical protein